MDNQKYNKINKIREYSYYFKNFSGGMFIVALSQGHNILAGISAGAYLVGDVIYETSQGEINNHLRKGLEDALKE